LKREFEAEKLKLARELLEIRMNGMKKANDINRKVMHKVVHDFRSPAS
jgi:hypothetical protein